MGELRAVSEDRALAEGRILLEFAMGLERQILIAYPERLLRVDQWARYRELVTRRTTHEPVSQITGMREFWGLPFKVTKETLTPRPDSETLIEAVISYFPDQSRPVSVLDLGVGTGCLLLSILSEYEAATGLGVDQSPKALSVARDNATSLGLEGRSSFQISDWFENVTGKYDIIVANPPYIAAHERLSLSADVRDFEPASALFAGEDGLLDYQRIARSIKDHLTEEGLVFIELGAGQGDAVSKILGDQNLQVLERICDLGGIERCLVIRK